MTPILLMKAIQELLTSELAGDVMTVPAVHLGYLPQKTKDNLDVPEYPFIIIRPLDGSDTDEGASVKIRLLFGTKSEDDDGFMDVLNLMERVYILLLKHRFLGDYFRLEKPYTWKLFEEQPEPEWIGEAITTWTLPAVLEEVPGI